MIENYVETKLIDYPDLYSQTFKEYMLPDGIYSSPFSADRVIKIAGPSVELVGGSGTTYRCCNLLSKTKQVIGVPVLLPVYNHFLKQTIMMWLLKNLIYKVTTINHLPLVLHGLISVEFFGSV